MNRREFLKTTALGAGALGLGKGKVNAQSAEPSAAMAQAASAFLERLGGARSNASLPLSSEQRTAWHWFPDNFYPNREGVTLKEMNAQQRAAALELLRMSTSERGFDKAQAIMATQRDLGRDPLDYHVTVFGDPASRAWAWAFEGHHLSLNYTVSSGQVVVAPVFLGASPTYQDNARRAVMRREEEAMREVMRSLSAAQRSTATFDNDTPGDTVTRNAVQVRALEPVGVLVSELSSAQQQLVLEVVSEYLSVLPPSLGATRLEIVRRELVSARLGWAGRLEPRNVYYYRLQGASFLLEHDNSRDGGTHIHSVWREIGRDFGNGLL
jgi:hypothetical protein